MTGGLPVPVVLWAVLGIFTSAPVAMAQDEAPPPVRPPAVEIGGGIGWVGQADAGTRDATMTANQPGGSEPLTFFQVTGKTRSGPVGVGIVGVNFSRRFAVEGGFQYSRPRLTVGIDEDVESTPSVSIEGDAFDQFVTEGNVVFHFNEARFDDRRTVPFVLAGVGAFRQEAEDGTSENGTIYQAGVGFKWFSGISRTGRANGLGMRLDVRYVFRDGGFDFEEDQRRSFVTFTANALFGF
jgi:hypothetical protein